jgi:hypothetical protein
MCTLAYVMQACLFLGFWLISVASLRCQSAMPTSEICAKLWEAYRAQEWIVDGKWALSLDSASETAQRRRVPILMYVNASFIVNGGVQAFEREVFGHPDFQRWSTEHVALLLAVRTSVRDVPQEKFCDTYGVTRLPQIVILSPEGVVLDRIDNRDGFAIMRRTVGIWLRHRAREATGVDEQLARILLQELDPSAATEAVSAMQLDASMRGLVQASMNVQRLAGLATAFNGGLRGRWAERANVRPPEASVKVVCDMFRQGVRPPELAHNEVMFFKRALLFAATDCKDREAFAYAYEAVRSVTSAAVAEEKAALKRYEQAARSANGAGDHASWIAGSNAAVAEGEKRIRDLDHTAEAMGIR